MAGGLRRAGHLELRQLGKENHNRQPVHKTQHHRMRHQSDELAPMHRTHDDLDDPHQHHRGKEILHPMLRHEAHHDDRQRARRARNHPRSPADQRGDQPDDEGRIKPHQRVHTGDKGKGHRFRHQRQRDGQARKQLYPQPRSAEIFGFGGKRHSVGKCQQRRFRHGSRVRSMGVPRPLPRQGPDVTPSGPKTAPLLASHTRLWFSTPDQCGDRQ